MKRGHDRLERRNFCLRVYSHWNTTTVVDDPHVAARKEGDLDIIGEAAHSFVARVIENFPHKVMQTLGTGRPDVHAWTLADRF